MKQGEKKDRRITSLYNRAVKGKYTTGGKFSYTDLVNDAIKIGVSKSTGEGYANEVIKRLQKTGHLK